MKKMAFILLFFVFPYTFAGNKKNLRDCTLSPIIEILVPEYFSDVNQVKVLLHDALHKNDYDAQLRLLIAEKKGWLNPTRVLEAKIKLDGRSGTNNQNQAAEYSDIMFNLTQKHLENILYNDK